MSLYLRPSPPSATGNAWSSLAGQNINDHKPVAGSGIIVKHGPNGAIISLNDELDPVNFTYQGSYSFSASYNPGDVVFVDPNHTYWDWNNNVIPICSGSSYSGLPPICAGLFVCTRFVPPYGYDIGYLTGSIATAYSSAGQSITGDFADTFRLYSYNVFWPIFPTIPISYLTTASLSSVPITANINYWAPLSPMVLINTCTGAPVYVNGVVSGSIFNPAQLPYVA